MEDMNVPELRAEAKRLGLKRYSRPRKQDLIRLISSAGQILDQPVPEIDASLLTPTRYFLVRPRVGPREFMQRAKPKVLKLIGENRKTRFMMILNCEMMRENEDLRLGPAGEEGSIRNSYPHFQSCVIENLERI